MLFRLLLCLFILGCVFDPADQVLGAKVWLFVALWIVTLAAGLSARDEIHLPMGLLVYVVLFITIPLSSIIWYYLSNGTQPYEGFALFKSYLTVSLAIVLVINRVDMIPLLSAVLTVLALLTIAIAIALQLYPELFLPLHEIGASAGVLLLGKRSYGEDLFFTQVVFVTVPMLAITIPQYFDRAMGRSGRTRLAYLALSVISMTAMILAGLRNTMAVAVLLPFFLWPLYTRRVALNGVISVGALTLLSLPVVEKLQSFLDPAEVSNNIKLTFLQDYALIFSDPITLFLGQGLGAYYRWTTSGLPDFEKTGTNFYFITELTYLEILRSFGLVGAAIMMALLLYPVAHAFLANTDRRQRALAVGFLAYLGMSATNPMLFSSTGMLILSALLAVIFQMPDVGKASSARSPH